jgi:hypothetical protein
LSRAIDRPVASLLDEFKKLDVILLSPIKALDKIYGWRQQYVSKGK